MASSKKEKAKSGLKAAGVAGGALYAGKQAYKASRKGYKFGRGLLAARGIQKFARSAVKAAK